MNEQELIIVSDSEPREEESGMTSLEPVVAVPESEEEWEMEDDDEHIDFTDRNIILADVKREMSNFIQQRATPLDIGEFKEQYTKNGSLPIAEFDPSRWGWNSYSSMIKDFATTEDFEVVSATRVTIEDFSQRRHLWCFALDPSNIEHWRYFFEGGFIKIKKDTLSIFRVATKAQDRNNRSLPQPPITRKPEEKSTAVEDASNRSRQSLVSNDRPDSEECVKLWGKGTCFDFQHGLCVHKACKYRHICGNCKSKEHGADSCPNKRRKSRVSKLPDPEECVRLYGKGTCYEFQKALCFRTECKYQHICANCRSSDHGADACLRRKVKVNPSNGPRAYAEQGVDRKNLIKPIIRNDPVNHKKKSLVDESLTSLELAEMIAAVNDDEVWDGQGDSRSSGKSITLPSNGNRADLVSYRRLQASGPSNDRSALSYVKGYCYKYQVGQCKERDSCPFKHQCTWCHGNHRGDLCPRKAGGQQDTLEVQARSRPITRTNSFPKPAAKETPLFSKPAVVPLFSTPALAPVFSKAAQPLMQKPLANSYDAMPSGSGGGYNRTPLSGGYNRTTQQGRAVSRRRPY